MQITPYPRARQWLGAMLGLLLGGCAAVAPNPEDVPRSAEPVTPPVTRLTSFSAALACMDDLFARNHTPTRYVTAISIPDQTGAKVGGGTLSMLISTISEMNRRSNAFQFMYLPVTFPGNASDLDPSRSGRIDLGYLLAYMKVTKGGLDFPDYLLVASVSELDRAVSSTSLGGGLDLGKLSIGASGETVISAMTTDFNVADGHNFKIINGADSTNSVALISRGGGVDLDAKLKSVGGYFTLSVDRAEGQHAALRSLIQLSAIETLGKLAEVPYQQCLRQERTPSGTLTRTGVPALELTSDRTRYRVGDKLKVRVRASRGTDLFCYYQNAKGLVWQILPTQFQPNTSLNAGASVTIPGTPRVDLVFDTPGSEQVMCLAVPLGSTAPLAATLPERVRRMDLQPLQIKSLGEVEDIFRATLRLPEDLNRADLRVQVE
ncbi:DUF4384 domain-containing protein [uncultured Thiocystis sp.]|jgi:hypothetical protein|uniref:DUF4384 domain-containing protein n=1 Tax=uncultured Thiocystis sp. TaxID=1202134 RepID=UPI0025CDB547|nr:DUF4384 domain-containing protein [uncultured Thiocystis sp.]